MELEAHGNVKREPMRYRIQKTAANSLWLCLRLEWGPQTGGSSRTGEFCGSHPVTRLRFLACTYVHIVTAS